MTRTYVATALNFFFPGAGYLVLGINKMISILWLAGVFGLTYVEQIHQFSDAGNLQASDPTAFGVMFVAVLLMNTAFAIDAFRKGKELAG